MRHRPQKEKLLTVFIQKDGGEPTAVFVIVSLYCSSF